MAAGRSTRFGAPKQLLPIAQTTMLEKVVHHALGSNLSQIIVVLGHLAETIQAKTDLSRTTVVVNPNYRMGQSTSVKAGIGRVATDSDAAMVLLADQPLVGKSVINALIDSFQNTRPPLVLPVFQGKRGNPVLISRSLFAEIRTGLAGDSGARQLFRKYSDQTKRVPMPNGHILFDVDEMGDYLRLLKTGST